MRGRGGWKCALEKCGELCVTTVGALTMLVWCADNWDLKWMYQGHVSSFSSFRFCRCTLQININHILLACCKKVVTYTSLMQFTDPTAYSNAHYGQGTGPIFLDYLWCNGKELFLLDCQYNQEYEIGNVRYCSHSQDAGVRCPCKD